MIAARPFAFPARAAFNVGSINAIAGVEEAAIKAALARGYEEGLTRGGAAAAAELRAMTDAALSEGREAGRREGAAELELAGATLRTALAHVEQRSQVFAAEAESFSVELALAAIAKLAGVDAVRTDFIKRIIAAAIARLAPVPPVEVLLNPSAVDAIKGAFPDLPVRADETMASGQVRIDGGRLLVEGVIDDALEALRTAVFAVQAHRAQTGATLAEPDPAMAASNDAASRATAAAAVKAKATGAPAPRVKRAPPAKVTARAKVAPPKPIKKQPQRRK